MLWFLTQGQAWGQYLSVSSIRLETVPSLSSRSTLRLPGTLGGGSRPPGLISAHGGNTNIVSETARPVCPSIRPGLEARLEEGMEEGRREHP